VIVLVYEHMHSLVYVLIDSLQQTHEVATVISPVLQIRKQRPRKMKQLGLGLKIRQFHCQVCALNHYTCKLFRESCASLTSQTTLYRALSRRTKERGAHGPRLWPVWST
jgi:hypothetical protein